jgi:nucleoside-diphosphate-sugar epimerase
MDRYDSREPINSGAESDVTIRKLAETIGRVVGFEGKLFDPAKPDGTPRKLMDSSRLAALGWRPKTSLGARRRISINRFLKYLVAANKPTFWRAHTGRHANCRAHCETIQPLANEISS